MVHYDTLWSGMLRYVTLRYGHNGFPCFRVGDVNPQADSQPKRRNSAVETVKPLQVNNGVREEMKA